MEIKERKSAFRDVPFMGVVSAVAEASKLGFYNGNPEWSNLGKGQPEIGEIEGAPPRINKITIDPSDNQYGPLGGIQELREAIADHYNNLFRKDKTSKYTADNVSVSMGGRLALSRIFATLDDVRLGFQNPDYTAYEDLINYHKGKISPISITTLPELNFSIPPSDFAKTVRENKLDAFLFSNPCNPTGNVIQGEDLDQYVETARTENCALISDEFYSHFIFDKTQASDGPVSSAAHVNDVDEDPVIIVDGLTKSFRYPGWRLGWIIGPKAMIDNINRAASAIDGGPSQPIQKAALQALSPEYASQETTAVRRLFSKKRNYMLTQLEENGILFSPQAKGTFYVWADVSALPEQINTADKFFREALKHKVLTIPGYFFDISPEKISNEESIFNQHLRLSFGPSEDNLKMGLDRLTQMIQSYK